MYFVIRQVTSEVTRQRMQFSESCVLTSSRVCLAAETRFLSENTRTIRQRTYARRSGGDIVTTLEQLELPRRNRIPTLRRHCHCN